MHLGKTGKRCINASELCPIRKISFYQYQTFYTGAVLQNESQHYEGKGITCSCCRAFGFAYAQTYPPLIFLCLRKMMPFEIMKHHFYKCGKKEVKIRVDDAVSWGKKCGSVLDSFNDSLYFSPEAVTDLKFFYYYAAAWMKTV